MTGNGGRLSIKLGRWTRITGPSTPALIALAIVVSAMLGVAALTAPRIEHSVRFFSNFLHGFW